MRRRNLEYEGACRTVSVLLAIASVSCLAVYLVLSPFVDRSNSTYLKLLNDGKASRAKCCRGVEHLEFWGPTVKWGSEHHVNSSQECCRSCKAMCTEDSSCMCNSWVYCGDRNACGDKYGQCWLKKQEDPLAPDIQEAGSKVIWTSGLVYGKDMGILAMETEIGAIRIKLHPDCAPWSVAYILELLKLRHCAGCHFYRAEGRGPHWDSTGKLAKQGATGPPYAVVQGTLEVDGLIFKEIPREACPTIKTAMVGWVEGGPDFFISLANHEEWYPKHTVFASVLPEDMHLVEKLASLPTISTIWSGVSVSKLEGNVHFKIIKALI